MLIPRDSASELLTNESEPESDETGVRPNLRTRFERALESLWVAFQPIVRASDRSVFGYESLLRTEEPSLREPTQVLNAAEQLGELERLGRSVRSLAVGPLIDSQEPAVLFLNLHPRDLLDPAFFDRASLLSAVAPRVVLEITERSSLEEIDDLSARVARLREFGFRIAVDDLGAGYAGLTSFALLEPDVVKLDMSLVRAVDQSPVKQKLVASMIALSRDLGLIIVAEGVETVAERDTLIGLGCDLFQGNLFARPGRPFPEPTWPESHALPDVGPLSTNDLRRGTLESLARAAEKERVRAERRAIERHAELSAFLVRDLKSPLAAILGGVIGLLDGKRPASKEAESLREIRDAALTMHRMILDLLDIHGAGETGFTARRSRVHVAELIDQARLAMSARAEQNGQSIETLGPLPPAVVEVDQQLLGRVLQNLIANGLEHGPSNATVWLGARITSRRTLLIFVRDEGPGVPPGLRGRIFEKPARVSPGVPFQDSPGRGLGLPFCHVAVEAHGGSIWVEDNAPRGACFFVELPLAP